MLKGIKHKGKKRPQVRYHALFKYHTTKDKVWFTASILLTVGVGALLPIFCIFIGDLLQSLTDIVQNILNAGLGNSVVDILSVQWRNTTLYDVVFDDEVQEGIKGIVNIVQTRNQSQELLAQLQADLNLLVIRMAIMGGIGLVLGTLQRVSSGIATRSAMERIRRLYIESLLAQDMSFHDKHTGGELVAHATVDMIKLEYAFGTAHSFLYMMIGTGISGIVVGFLYDVKLAAFCLIFVPFIMLTGLVLSRIASASQGKASQVYCQAAACAEEALCLIKTVCSLGGQEHEVEQYYTQVKDVEQKTILQSLTLGIGTGASMCILYASCALIMWFAYGMVDSGEITAGAAMTVFYAVIVSAVALGQIFLPISDIAAARGCAYTIYNTIDRVSAIDSLSDEGIVPDSLQGTLDFTNVKFRYVPDGQVILHDFSLQFPAGKTVALAGSSGSGKSTALMLLERFYDVEEGRVEVDGHNIKDLHLGWLRNQIGYVGQEPVLFAGSIATNIALGAEMIANPDFNAKRPADVYANPRFVRQEVTLDQVIAASSMANAHEFISNMPDGYDTLIGEGGGMLSGGQKQRIAIARALLRDPRILLLDEATSALDVKSESVVQAAMEKAAAGRTTIIVAHRLRTIRNADVICFMHQGRILETGSHDELVARGGGYAEYVRIQTKHSPSEANRDDVDATMPTDPPATAQALRSTTSTVDKDLDKADPDITAGNLYHLDSDDEVALEDSTGAEPKKKQKRNQFMQLLKMNRPEIPTMLVGMVAAVITGLLWPVFAYAMGEMIFVYMTLNEDQAQKWIKTFLALAGIALFTNSIMYWCFGAAKQKLTRRLRVSTFRMFMKQDMGFFDMEHNKVSELTVSLSNDAAAVGSVMGDTVIMTLVMLSTLVATFVIGVFLCWQLALVMMSSFFISGLVSYVGSLLANRITKKAENSLDEATTMASEYLQSVRTVTYLGVSTDILQRYRDYLEAPRKSMFKASIISGLTFGFAQCVILSVWGFSFWFGVEMVTTTGGTTQECTMKEAITTFAAVVFGGLGMISSLALAPDVNAARTGAARLFMYRDQQPTTDTGTDEGVHFANPALLGQPLSGKAGQMESSSVGLVEKTSTTALGLTKCIPVEGDVAFHHIAFTYPARPRHPVLTDFSVDVGRGQTLALVGESGCGKSSCLGLLERFYTAAKGQITVDGIPVEDVNVKSLRRTIGMVGQEPHLFTGTIRENMLYGLSAEEKAELTDDSLWRAIDDASAREFVELLGEKLDTHIGVRGSRLSGGQKQRIAIARTLLRDPQIVLLDEATSALDAQSESAVQAALDKMSATRTTITVAHRLATVRNADIIAVVAEGVIKESGTHEELMAIPGGRYKAMMKLQ
ncbi:hypothetical protein SARC_03632 [Sphaeroforma arctica JP610]|uniref:Uncharacterized protein n=1 Tax=Sphaeroforma arctica JP610 TaxID=667725 RepID=A0A0L0G7E7_9EUKA|nr:hypothetical protein SARC_03632 [Sphaeroforma arctica JP610]KNC84133.1 hypothetical protein SARC_03632 [Sphaeroforma arctica JP610]|eukprot:XP_014158035.1 hypothetical protein SARC_03632 [Sphaeroforma arctica JP610]